MPTKIKLTIPELEKLLNEQKLLVIDLLANNSAYYNTDSTQSISQTMFNLDKDQFKSLGLRAGYPDDFHTLKKYLE